MEKGITLEQQMMCTWIGASITSVCTTPLDVVKVRLQAEQRRVKSHNHARLNLPLSPLCECRRLMRTTPMRFEHTCANPCFRAAPFLVRLPQPSPNVFKASLDVGRAVASKEGLLSLWSGLTPSLLMSIPGTMIYYTAYDRLKEALGYDRPDPRRLPIAALAGSIARVAAVTAVSPIELMRTKMQSQHLSYSDTFRCIRTSVAREGCAVLFRGLGPSILRDVPFSAIYWMSYEGSKVAYCRRYDSPTPPALTFVAGALSGTMAALLTCPFDVVKTHRQIEVGDDARRLGRRKSTFSLLKALYRAKGSSALFAGVVPRVVKVAPACAIMITSYEMGKNYFRQKNTLIG